MVKMCVVFEVLVLCEVMFVFDVCVLEEFDVIFD